MSNENMKFPVGYKRDLGNGNWVMVSERHGRFVDLLFSNSRKILWTTDRDFISKNYMYKFNTRISDRTGSQRIMSDGVSIMLISDYRGTGDIDIVKFVNGEPEFYFNRTYWDYENELLDGGGTITRHKYRKSKKRERNGSKQDLGDGYVAVCNYKSSKNCKVDIVSKSNPNEKLVEGVDMTWDRYCNGRYAKEVMNQALGKSKGVSVMNIGDYLGKPVRHKKYGEVTPIRSEGKLVRVLVKGGGIQDVKLTDLRVDK